MLRNALSLLLLAGAQAANVVVDVTCPNAPNSFTVDDVENGNVTVTAGDTVWFNVTCASGFQITNSSGTVLTSGVSPTTPVTNEPLTLNTTVSSTPLVLLYASPSAPAMKGTIFVSAAGVGPATTPTITSVTAVQDLPYLNITWTPGNAGSCIFASWDLLFATGGNGSVPGCTNLTSVAVTSCQATLNGSTSYSFTIQRLCTNPLANSNISIVSGVGTTVSVAGTKICQNVNTCNCGNAETCVCQLTQVCNCQNAGRCVCQGGECNGGNAQTLICNFPTGCNKQCAASCPLCLGSTIGGFFGGGDSCSDAGVIHASLALIAVLFAFSW